MNARHNISPCRERAARQRGLALVEATIAIPILVLLLIPVGEIVRAFVQYSTLSHSARNAVRYVAEHAISDTTGVPVITAELTAAARNLVVYGAPIALTSPMIPGLTVSEVSVPVIRADGNVEISVIHPYQSLLPLGGVLPLLGLSLKDIPLTVTYSQRPL